MRQCFSGAGTTGSRENGGPLPAPRLRVMKPTRPAGAHFGLAGFESALHDAQEFPRSLNVRKLSILFIFVPLLLVVFASALRS
jgi:hypothetical protein